MPTIPRWRLAGYTVLALIAFAANSVLCRLALGDLSIDAASFTATRLIAGGLMLLVLMSLKERRFNARTWLKSGSIKGALYLFVYAATFSFAYVQLDTATGALILFGTVQLTMVLLSLFRGERMGTLEWIGFGVALAGFVYLILPGLTTPSVTGFVLMMASGIAWGLYTLNGRGSRTPMLDTTGNFVRTAPLVLLLFLPFIDDILITPTGFWLAISSGALASALGYILWYSALPHLTGIQASVYQLSVPLIAALGGVVLVGESLTARLGVATLMLLGGIGLLLWGKRRQAAQPASSGSR
ncbi:DMT family transporter [Saccharospirillum salsuginis]|uniref:EamA domain-containing protein n=1 Tax=Saccharospirillum salsuginis TaxID=418750 RepID=A0A918KM44_9GAMM|nr:EamA family transporter [Saccharospirillum salsuginis]GGX67725.1 hypothetical protein GCM10007392_39240 [Saccharospirillum salsuginis]